MDHAWEVDNSEEEEEDKMYLMALALQIITQKKKKQKRAVWVQEIYRNHETDGIRRLANIMKVLNRE